MHTRTNVQSYVRVRTPNLVVTPAKFQLIKCKNIFTKMLKDVGIEVPKSIETRSKCSMHADKGRG